VRTRALAIVNPGAGGHPRADQVRELLTIFERAGTIDIVELTSDGETVADLARHAVERGMGAVIVAGGDHTVQLAGRELLGTRTVLGILPFGRSMNITKGLRIPTDPLAAADVIARGHVRRADVGEVNGQVFFESAGIGLDAEAFGAVRAAGRGRWRRALRRAARWATQGTHTIRVRRERGESTYRAMQVLVLNSPFYTWSFPMVGGDMHDGLLEVAIFPRMGRRALLGTLLRLWREGRHESPPIVLRERAVHIAADTALPIQADTRAAGTLPATFKCRAGALAVYVPEPDAT
jgi:diacylglycerol kinase family enzyme